MGLVILAKLEKDIERGLSLVNKIYNCKYRIKNNITPVKAGLHNSSKKRRVRRNVYEVQLIIIIAWVINLILMPPTKASCEELILENTSSPHSGEINKYEKIIDQIRYALPNNWKIHKIDYNNHPHWSFSNDTCVLIEAYGPQMGGWIHYDGKGNTTKVYFKNEARSIWLVPDTFDPQWTISNRIKNRLNKTPISYPKKVTELKRVTVYGDICYVVLKINERKFNETPKGYIGAEPFSPENGGSWPTWIEDIRKSIATIF
jgi:hypothetical protein